MRTMVLWVMLSGIAGGVFAQTAGTEQIFALEQRLVAIKDPVVKLFFEAKLEHMQGEPEQALQTLARLLLTYPRNTAWALRSELMSAEIYQELGLFEAADVTARQIEFMNPGTAAAEKARLFREKLKQVQEQSEETE